MTTTTSTPATTSVSISDARIDVEALEFTQRRNLVDYLNAAVQLATRHFSPIQPIWVELMLDPEGDWDKLVLNVAVVGTGQSVRDRDDAFGKDFIAAIPPDARYRISVIPDIRSTE